MSIICKDCRAELMQSGLVKAGPHRPAPYPGPRCATHHRVEQLRRKAAAKAKRLTAIYSITAEQYAAQLAFQGGTCAICQKVKGITRALAVDHDHACCDGPTSCGSCWRGLLCKRCNRTLGDYRDDATVFQRFAEYLTNWPTRRARSASATSGSPSATAGSSAPGATDTASSGSET